MIKLKPVFLGVLFLFLGSTGFILGQNVPVIENIQTDPVIYCSDLVYVAPAISVDNIQIDAADKGMQVSIVNYEVGEDKLGYNPVAALSYSWNNSTGALEISGIASDEEYREAIANVYYYNQSNTRNPGIREFSISLLDADYLPETDHFYQYIANRGIRWTEAKTAAENLTYYGLQGYLATIMSSTENDFIYSKIDGVGWIGGNDATDEGEWYWRTGPEAGTQFWRGTANGTRVGGNFAYWNNGEPNNSAKDWNNDDVQDDDEDYAHMVVDPGGKPKSWNDLSDEGDKNQPDGYYYPQGYLVEFGGMENLDLQLSATAYIEVRETKRPELDYDKVQTLHCGVMTSTVGLIFRGATPQVELLSLDGNAQIDNGLTSTPTISVKDFGEFLFQLNTIDIAGCAYSDTVMFEFHNQPEAAFSLDENECYGYNLQLAFDGVTKEEAEFTWYYNAEVFTSGTEIDSVTIPLGFDNINRTVALKVNEQGCTAVSLPKTVNVKPSISVTSDNMSGCSPITTSFAATSNNTVESYLWDFDDGTNSDEAEPEHFFTNSVDELLAFDVSLTVLDQNGCENTAVYDSLVKVYPVPTADFDFEPQEILITAPEVEFENLSHAATDFYWDFGDSTSTTEKDPNHRFTSLGFYNIWLQVANDFTCTDTIAKQIRVTFDKLNPPNAFSPNATLTENREFRLYADGVVNEGYSMLIFNRWGELIFQSNTQQQGWDGKMQNGKFAPAGVYTWVLNYYDFSGDLHKQKGNVTLLF